MAEKVKPPLYSKGKGYERYKQELMAWKEISTVEKKKQGILVALSLPEEDDSGIRERVFDEVSLEDLKKDEGLNTLVAYMDKKLGKDDLADCLEKFEDFEDFKREPGHSMEEFVSKFDHKYNKIQKLKMTLPNAILGFMLIKKANLTKAERMLVLTGIDYSKKDELYDQAKSSLMKFKGEQARGIDEATAAIKLEPAYFTNQNEVLWNSGRGSRGATARGFRGGRGRPWVRGKQSQSNPNRYERRTNPKGPDGKVLLCKSCGSFRHFVADCPDSWENTSVNVVDSASLQGTNNIQSGESVLFTMMTPNSREDLEDVVFMTKFNDGKEATNCAVLDSACSSTVCGSLWMDDFLASLSPSDREKVKNENSEKTFRFGGGETLTSLGAFLIPATVADKKIMIKTDVVDSNIPLLLSKDAMKKASMKLDLENDTAQIFGTNVVLNETSSGHYCIPIRNEMAETKTIHESVNEVHIGTDDKKKYRALLKLHRQFAHPSQGKLKLLLQDAKVWNHDVQEKVEKIYKRCEICKRHSRAPSRPVVALPMASRFNEKVCMDLKKWRGKWILHLIDMWSRFSVSVFISRKHPSNVIDKIMQNWIGAGFGMMGAILTDNGGEFCSDEMREVCSILNVEKLTTAAQSPFQNGLCERNHAVVDNMLEKMKDQCPDTPEEILLCWANMAKNSLQMWHGFSSYQLVFGQNPNLPNIMTDKPPALEGTSTSEMLVQHLNSLHAARKAFTASEADERIRRALRGKVRAAEHTYKSGDSVYYKRDANNRWLGPGKVVFQDGKVVFVRHGSTFVRVSPNRLSPAGGYDGEIKSRQHNTRGDEFADSDTDDDDPPQNRCTISEQGQNENTEPNHDNSGVQSDGHANVTQATVSEQDQRGDLRQLNDRSGIKCGESEKINLRKDDEIQYKIDDDDNEWMTASIISRGGKLSGGHKNWFNVKDSEGNEKGLNFDQITWRIPEEVNIVLIPRDEHGSDACVKAKLTELEKLKKFDTYEEVPDCGQFAISTTWVLWHKEDEIRARLVARGYEDDKSYPRDSPTIGKTAMRVTMSVAASQGWKIQTTDIKSAFLQGKKIEREVYLKPPKEIKRDGYLWRLKHCLYGLNDAARHFYQSVADFLRSVGCTPCLLDPALFIKHEQDELVGFVACHVDDFLHAGTKAFDTSVMIPLRQRFSAGKIQGTAFHYVGFHVMQDETGIIIDQNSYVSNLEDVPLNMYWSQSKDTPLERHEQRLLRQLVGRLNWAVQGTRPDMAFDMIWLSTKLKDGTVADLVQAVKCIRKLKNGASSIKFANLGPSHTWKIVVYSDASHANLEDAGSLGAHIVFIVNSQGHVCTINWAATKIKRVVRSSLAAEMLSLQDGLEDAIYIRKIVSTLLNQREVAIPITAYVDNKSVVQSLMSTKLVEDKRLRVDIAAIKQSLCRNEIKDISWISGEDQLANCMTKRGASGQKLIQTLMRGHLDYK